VKRDGRTFEEARRELQRQSVERGFGGRLEDVSVTLTEDGKHVSVWSHQSLDDPLMACFDLPSPISPDEFDAEAYEAKLLGN
jgi:hypothetical protein